MLGLSYRKLEVNQMGSKTKARITAILVVILLVATMGCVSKESDVLIGLPEGNFTLLGTDDPVGGGTIVKLHDDDSNITMWIYRNNEQGGMWGCPDWQLTPQNMSND